MTLYYCRNENVVVRAEVSVVVETAVGVVRNVLEVLSCQQRRGTS